MSQRPYLRRLTGQTVVVHTTDGQSVRGVLSAVYADVYVLRAATYLRDGPAEPAAAAQPSDAAAASAGRWGPPPPPRSPDVPVDGDFLVPRGKVAFLQHLRDVETQP